MSKFNNLRMYIFYFIFYAISLIIKNISYEIKFHISLVLLKAIEIF